MTKNQPADANAEDLLIDRLYAELKATPTESQEFEAAFKYLRQVEDARAKRTDAETIELEREVLKVKIQKDKAEIARESAPKPWFRPSPDAVITAAASIAGILLIVAAEQFGNQILNSKAMQKLPNFKV